jgi:hypothetical protein
MPIEKSTRTRKGLFGRQITVEKTKVKETTPKGEATDTYKKRTVSNRNTGKSKERFVQKSTVKGEGAKPYIQKNVTKTKSEAPTMTGYDRDKKRKGLDYESTKMSTEKSRTKIKKNGKVSRSRDKRNIITTTKTAGRMGKTAMRARLGANEAYDETLQDTYEMNRPRTGEINFKSKPSNPKLKSARPKTGEIKFR